MKASCGKKAKGKVDKMPMKNKMPSTQVPMKMTMIDSKIKKLK